MGESVILIGLACILLSMAEAYMNAMYDNKRKGLSGWVNVVFIALKHPFHFFGRWKISVDNDLGLFSNDFCNVVAKAVPRTFAVSETFQPVDERFKFYCSLVSCYR